MMAQIIPSTVTPSSIRDSISERVRKTGYTMTGNLNMNNNAVINVKESISDDDVATKRYVDDIRNEIDELLLTSGDTMTGNLNMNQNKITDLGDPAADTDAATKKYVDDSNIPTMTSLSTINDGMTTFRSEYSTHVLTFLNRAINTFFGSPAVIDIKLVDIKRLPTVQYTQPRLDQHYGHHSINPLNIALSLPAYTGSQYSALQHLQYLPQFHGVIH